MAGRYETLFVVLARQATRAGEIDSSESITGLHKRSQIRALLSSSSGSHVNTDCGLDRKICTNYSDRSGLLMVNAMNVSLEKLHKIPGRVWAVAMEKPTIPED
jgi:hypothetical protein